MNLLTPAVLATVAAAMLTATTARAEPRNDSASEKLGFQLGLQCWTYRMLTTFETLERAQKLGLKYLEIFPGQKMKAESDAQVGTGLTDEQIADLLAKAKACGVKIASYGVSGIPTDADGARRHFEWARKMGLEVLVTETTPNEMLDKLSQEFGIRIALHNHPQSWPADKVLEATQGLSGNCGACVDTGHWLRAGKTPVENLKLLKGRIVESHFKDLNEQKEDVVYGSGVCDVKGMLQELKRQGFRGHMNMEYERGDLNHLDEVLPQCVAAFDKICAEVAAE
jgi:sugar phosphate isomerase/epimerase